MRRAYDTVSSDGDSDKNIGPDCFPSAKRMLIDKFMTPRSKPVGTPGSRLRQTPRLAASTSKSNSSSSNGTVKPLRVVDPIGVYCRVRPWGQSDEERCVKIIDEKSLLLSPPESAVAWKLNTAKELTFSFQRVYGFDTDQQSIFESIALPLVEDVLKGKNALLFAYGVTGSGKTYTMSGTGEETGLMPRCLDVIFNSIEKHQARKFVFKPDRMNGFDVQTQADAMLDKQREINQLSKTPKSKGGNGRMAALHRTPSDIDMYNRKKDTRCLNVILEDSQYAVFVTYIEIYNNFVYDLLDESSFDERSKKFNLQSKMLREDAHHNIYVNGVTEVEVCSAEEAFDVFLRGQKRRKQAHTALNTASSRSHAVFNIRLVQAPYDAQGEEVLDEKDKICVSQLSLVDLAGSERYGRTQATGDRLKEAGNINNSLMTLRKCMDILRDNQQGGNKPVPYRDTKLTHYLKNYFEGEGRVRMILCLNPRNEDYDENIHVLAFAELTKEIQVSRAPERKLDHLTPGRRKANEIFKEARRKIMEEIPINENAIPVDVNLVYGLGPPLPLGQMNKSDEDALVENLRRALELRIRNRADLAKLLLEKRHNFRMHLIDVERDLEVFKQENMNLKYKLNQLGTEKESLDNQLKTIQFEKHEQDIRYEELEAENRQLREELENCRMEMRQKEVTHMKDKERLKTDLELQMELNERKIDRELQKKEIQLRESYKCKDKTFEAIRQLIEESDGGRARRSRSRVRRRSSSLSSTTSDSEIQVVSGAAKTRSRVISVSRLDSPLSPVKSRSGGVAISNPRRYRAHSSDNDRWLEHTPGQPVKSGTVFQPVMKKKKSVTKLTNVDDLAKKSSKYCLNLQEADSEGGLETKLYKGDVLPSRSGGAQVVFHDVEILRQVSPTNVDSSPKKRASSALLTFPTSPQRNGSGEVLGTYDEYDAQVVDADTVAQRCATGIGHTGASKRLRHQ